MRRQLVPALLAFLCFTVLVGVLYPLAITGVSQVALGDRADGSLVRRDGVVVGSSLLGQSFTGEQWFQPRPSAAGDGYDGAASAASSLGPTNPELLSAVEERIAAYRALNGLPDTADVPVDAVTASASGLDPDISPENARIQAPRVARARGLAPGRVLELVEAHTHDRTLGFMGERRVNVLALNLALDAER
jgi:K+-transporting ATPase ATPase C chain